MKVSKIYDTSEYYRDREHKDERKDKKKDLERNLDFQEILDNLIQSQKEEKKEDIPKELNLSSSPLYNFEKSKDCKKFNDFVNKIKAKKAYD